MKISLKFFASLREAVGQSDAELELDQPVPVTAVWQQATGQSTLPANTLCAINMEYVDADTLVNDGDEVAFFPPVTGG